MADFNFWSWCFLLCPSFSTFKNYTDFFNVVISPVVTNNVNFTRHNESRPFRLSFWGHTVVLLNWPDVIAHFIAQVSDECWRIKTFNFIYIMPVIVFITKVRRIWGCINYSAFKRSSICHAYIRKILLEWRPGKVNIQSLV